jgi:predicted dithiol-disulfide oxidoreductase (DUF899 family)
MQITTAKLWVLTEQLITHLEKKDIILLKFHLTISEHFFKLKNIMNWKQQIENLEHSKKWKFAIDFLVKTIDNRDDVEGYIRMLYAILAHRIEKEIQSKNTPKKILIYLKIVSLQRNSFKI